MFTAGMVSIEGMEQETWVGMLWILESAYEQFYMENEYR